MDNPIYDAAVSVLDNPINDMTSLGIGNLNYDTATPSTHKSNNDAVGPGTDNHNNDTAAPSKHGHMGDAAVPGIDNQTADMASPGIDNPGNQTVSSNFGARRTVENKSARRSVFINITVPSDKDKASVELIGSLKEIISHTEQMSFGLTDSVLKDAVQRYTGGSRPADVYFKSPTPWGDLYQRYGWSQVQRTLYPHNAKILDIKSEPVVLATHEFINYSSVKGTYNTGISQEVQDTISSIWSKRGELTVGQEINYSVNIAFGQIGGITSISYAASWGQEHSKSKTVTVGSNSGVQIELEPEQAVIATLTATRGIMVIQVDYIARLNGDLACNYPHKHEGHHFWRYGLNAVQRVGGLRQTIESTELIKIDFYSDAQVVITDKKTRSTLKSVNVGIV